MFKRTKERLFIVAHIERASASAAAFLVRGTVPELVAHHRYTHSPAYCAGTARIENIARELDTVLEKLSQHVGATYPGRSVERVFVVVHAPWSRSQTVFVRRDFDTDQKISEQLISELATLALEELQDVDAGALIESRVTRVSLNGYQTAQPIGIAARRLEVAVLVSDCEKELQQRVGESIHRLFASAGVEWRSMGRNFMQLEDTLPGGSYMSVVFGDDASEILLVRDDLLYARTHVNRGAHDLLNALSNGFPEETVSLLSLAAQGTAHADALRELHGNFAQIENGLTDEYVRAFDALLSRGALPDRLALVAPRELSGLLGHLFSRREFASLTNTGRPFEVYLVHSTADDTLRAMSHALINTEAVQ